MILISQAAGDGGVWVGWGGLGMEVQLLAVLTATDKGQGAFNTDLSPLASDAITAVIGFDGQRWNACASFFFPSPFSSLP